MVKKKDNIKKDLPVTNEESVEDLKIFIRKKNIQNKVLKELIDQLQKEPEKKEKIKKIK
jgi:hypothetical protein